MLLVVMDNMTFLSIHHGTPSSFKENLQQTFGVKFYGHLGSLLGWEITKNENEVCGWQKDYAIRLWQRFGLASCSKVYPSLPSKGIELLQTEKDLLPWKLQHQYRSMVGAMSHLSICTLPDLTYSFSLLSGYFHNPCSRSLSLCHC